MNVLTGVRCIACGTAFDGEPTPPNHGPGTISLDPSQVREMRDDRDHSDSLPEIVDGPSPARTGPGASQDLTDAAGRNYMLRLLVADIGPSNVEVGTQPRTVGSGPHAIGEKDDPCCLPAEGRLFVSDGELYVDPAPESEGLFIRLRDEAKLEDGDVLLIGHVAARFSRVAPSEPIDGTRQVLGGTASSPCGRLTFLRRDGSPGPVHDVPAGKTILGRTGGHLNFPEDSRLSRRHACLVASENGVRLEDMGSRNGTFLRVRRTWKLEPGDALRVGSAGLIVRGVATDDD